MVSAANSKATKRVIFFLAKKLNTRKTGHSRRDFASNQSVKPPISNGAVKKGNTPQAMAAMIS